MLTRLSHSRRPLTVRLAIRSYSSGTGTRAKPQLAYRVPETYTIAIGPKTTKTQALQALRDSVLEKGHGLTPTTHSASTTAAVVLASRGLASWLEDPAFIRSVLRTHARRYASLDAPDPDLPPGQVSGEVDDDGLGLCPPPPETSVLTAAVDSIPLLRGRGPATTTTTTEGISVLHGNRLQLLHDLWENAGASRQDDPDAAAALVFKVPGLGNPEASTGGGGGAEVTVPVASTVFHNGRTSTMFATRWSGRTWAEYGPVEQRDVTQTAVRLTRKGNKGRRKPPRHDEQGQKEKEKEEKNRDKAVSSVTVPLVPITAPVRIRAGLGNIIKRVAGEGEGEGGEEEVRTASEELERVIPELLSARERLGLAPVRGPLGVWALIVPDEAAGTAAPLLRAGPEAFRPAEHFRLLLEAGCRVHRVLSGGGGWGDKKGLLSLDPQTKFSTTDDEDIDAFARSFLGVGNGPGADSLSSSSSSSHEDSMIRPGDRVSFFVTEQMYPFPPEHDSSRAPVDYRTPQVSLCVEESAGMEEGEGARSVPDDLCEVSLNYFAAASSQCIFVGPDRFRGLTRPAWNGARQETSGTDAAVAAVAGEAGGDKSLQVRLTSVKLDVPGAGVSITGSA